MFSGSASDGHFETPHGVYVVTDEVPVLNPRLLKSTIAKLRKERVELGNQVKTVRGEIQDLSDERARLDEMLRDCRELETLNEEAKEWSIQEAQANETIQETMQAQERLFETRDLVSGQIRTVENQHQTVECIRKELDELQGQAPVELSSKIENQRLVMEEARRKAGRLIDLVGHDYGKASDHDEAWKELNTRLDGVDEPTDEDLQHFQRMVSNAQEREALRETEIRDLEEELNAGHSKVDRLRKELAAHEQAEFRRLRRRIAELGAKYGVRCKVDRTSDKGNPGQFLLDFKVSHRTTDEGAPLMESIKRSSSSTGENTKACILFMMALSPGQTKSFYIFDEPAAAFSEENLEDMWQIFRDVGHQVIITSTKPGDYGEKDVDIEQIRLCAEPRHTPKRKALPAEYNIYRDRHVITPVQTLAN